MRLEKFQRACVALVSVSFLTLGMQVPAAANVIGTAEAIAASSQIDLLATVRAAVSRDDVRARFAQLGVDAIQLDGRLAALSEAELAMLADRLDETPAGGGALEVVGIVFVVLMILEFTGVIDIFKKR
ncbi:MAG TPA: PA2779 family protein [Steroidobacteraceae bacterium]|nr:PA2779 family protein [Steroidobacteraceae bacterium]